MSTSPEAAEVPSIDQLSSEVIATLLYAARSYLDRGTVGDAEIAIDIAAQALQRAGDRFSQNERSVLANVLAETRIECVRRRSG